MSSALPTSRQIPGQSLWFDEGFEGSVVAKVAAVFGRLRTITPTTVFPQVYAIWAETEGYRHGNYAV